MQSLWPIGFNAENENVPLWIYSIISWKVVEIVFQEKIYVHNYTNLYNTRIMEKWIKSHSSLQKTSDWGNGKNCCSPV